MRVNRRGWVVILAGCIAVLNCGSKLTSALAGELFDNEAGSLMKIYQQIKVEKVLAVDLLVLENGEKIRLIGLRAPEKPRRAYRPVDENGFVAPDNNPSIPLEERAFDFVRELLEGQMVRLEFDARRSDDDMRTLAYVYTVKDQIFVNAEILRRGFAFLQVKPPNFKYAEQLRVAYREAREQQRGLQGE